MLGATAHQGLVCFITLVIHCQVACQKEQRQASVSVTEFIQREASSWVNSEPGEASIDRDGEYM